MTIPKQVVVFPRGQLTPRDRRSLAKAGVCVVEADDPAKVVAVLPGVPLLSGDDLLRAALSALVADKYTNNTNERFVKSLAEAVRAVTPSPSSPGSPTTPP